MGLIHRYCTALARHHRSAGFGVHSPFAYQFVLNVLHERLPYYDYETIEELHRAALESARRQSGWRSRVISLKEAKMLFRVTNFFNPCNILQIGEKYGISSVSMLSVSSTSRLFIYGTSWEDATVVAQVLKPHMDNINCYDSLDVAIDEYREALTVVGGRPFLLVNDVACKEDFETLKHFLVDAIEQESVIVMRNLCRNRLVKELFGLCTGHMTHGQTFTNEKTGIIVVSHKLQLEYFPLWF